MWNGPYNLTATPNYNPMPQYSAMPPTPSPIYLRR